MTAGHTLIEGGRCGVPDYLRFLYKFLWLKSHKRLKPGTRRHRKAMRTARSARFWLRPAHLPTRRSGGHKTARTLDTGDNLAVVILDIRRRNVILELSAHTADNDRGRADKHFEESVPIRDKNDIAEKAVQMQRIIESGHSSMSIFSGQALPALADCRDVLHTWGSRATRRHAVERLVGAQRHAAVSTKSNSPRGALESWVPFSEQLVESSIEDGAANL
jgi:hypothetical protein